MKWISALIFACVCLFASEIKIATFNVENLFDGQNNGNEYRDFKIGSSNWNSEKYIKKLANISKIIKNVDADIIALQEVENNEVIRRLAQKNGYEYYKFAKPDKSPVGVGVLSRLKIEDSEIYRPNKIKTRDILRVDFRHEGEDFSLFICHFPAAKNSIRDRRAVANLLKNGLKERKNAIAIGDFNSDYGNKFLLNTLLKEDKFTNLWKFVAANKRSSHVSFRAIDHVILAPSFFTSNGLNYKKNSFDVYKPGPVTAIFGAKNSYSDHYPLYFKLTTDPYKNDIKSVDIEEIYIEIDKKTALEKELKIQKAAVIYKDKNGFIISQNGRGIYVFDRDHSDIALGSLIDLVVYGAHKFRENTEINSFEISKIYDDKVEITHYMLPVQKLAKAKSGDVLQNISGDVKNGVLKSEFGEIKIYNPNKTVKNGKNQSFNEALVRNFDGKKELVVREFE